MLKFQFLINSDYMAILIKMISKQKYSLWFLNNNFVSIRSKFVEMIAQSIKQFISSIYFIVIR